MKVRLDLSNYPLFGKLESCCTYFCRGNLLIKWDYDCQIYLFLYSLQMLNEVCFCPEIWNVSVCVDLPITEIIVFCVPNCLLADTRGWNHFWIYVQGEICLFFLWDLLKNSWFPICWNYTYIWNPRVCNMNKVWNRSFMQNLFLYFKGGLFVFFMIWYWKI